MRKRVFGLAAAILLLAALAPATGANAKSARTGRRTVDVGIQHVQPNKAADLKLDRRQARQEIRQTSTATSAPVTAQSTVGDEKFWLAVDFQEGSLYLKAYTLRAIGDNIEVWVASDEDEVSTGTDFPDGDCRNDERTEITTSRSPTSSTSSTTTSCRRSRRPSALRRTVTGRTRPCRDCSTCPTTTTRATATTPWSSWTTSETGTSTTRTTRTGSRTSPASSRRPTACTSIATR